MIKLLIGGSPCTKWSIAQHNRETTNSGEGWELFKNYILAKELFKPDYFLYENNTSASTLIKASIENELGHKRIELNSSLVSAQNRSRFYVSNIGEINIPESSPLCVRDILDVNTEEQVYKLKQVRENPEQNKKTGMIKVGSIGDGDAQCHRVYSIDGKSCTLCAGSGGLGAKTGLYLLDNGDVRKLTVNEARRLQNIPDWVKIPVSNTQAYKQIGNGWTIDIIKLFFEQLPKDEDILVLSMFDGMSCGHITLKELGLNVKEYIAVEIDKYCQKTIMENFPETKLFSDAFDIRDKESELYKYILEKSQN